MKSATNSPELINSPQKRQQKPCLGQSGEERSAQQLRQLKVWGLSQAKKKASPYLQIASVPIKERIDPKEVRYVLVILPHGIRAAGGQFSAEEAHAIANAVKGWDWQLGEDGRLQCLAKLKALLDSICKRSFEKGGDR